MPATKVNAKLAFELIGRSLFTRVTGAPAGTVWTDADFAVATTEALLQMVFAHQVPLDIATTLAQIALRELGCTSAVAVGFQPGASAGEGLLLRLTSADSTEQLVTLTASVTAGAGR